MRTFSVITRSAMLSVLLCASLLGASRASAQDPGDRVLQHVQTAFLQGNARALLDYAAERVEIGIFGQSTLYSRAQALYVMQNFFREYPPVRFTLQEPSKADNSWFTAGQYWHESGNAPSQVYIRLRQKGQQWELREIRIEQRARE